ncbi:hypothetical protein TNCV_2596611 [Trichonephila clavipes]|nr:hypothetical protein TNCV_2596611 [Trichonephila clavipes]
MDGQRQRAKRFCSEWVAKERRKPGEKINPKRGGLDGRNATSSDSHRNCFKYWRVSHSSADTDGRILTNQQTKLGCIIDPTIKQQSSERKHPSSPTPKKGKTVKLAGLPSEAEEENCDLIVHDDMMNYVTSEISQMFTMGSHHKKYSIILITQNLFPESEIYERY